MSKKNIGIIIMSLLLMFIIPGCASADLKPEPEEQPVDTGELFNKYWNMQQDDAAGSAKKKSTPAAQQAEFPGWIVGDWTQSPKSLFYEKWPYRIVTYEIYFASRSLVGRMIYGLAIHSGDLDPSVSLERFERGVGGFHYSTGQIVDWANAVLDGKQKTYTVEEEKFLSKLVSDRVMLKVNGRYTSIGTIRHILGVAPSKKRSIEINLSQERTHVMWDEDPEFRDFYIKKWKSLSNEEKEKVYAGLKGYNRDNEMQIIEEWAVYQNEKKQIWKK